MGPASPRPDVLIEASGITKSFAGVRALRDVSFELRAGEVHALIGENGAGKSTLIRIVTGAERADGGVLRVAGTQVPHLDPHQARMLGIAAIYQQPSLFAHLTVAENIAFGHEEARPWARVRWAGRRGRAAELLDRIGAPIDPDRLVDSLSMPEQQMVEIARALGASARVVIMDEPTASLSTREVERLFAAIARLRAARAGVIYISHRLEEIGAIADRITVLRDGATIATREADTVDRSELIRLMVGRELAAVFPKRAVPAGDVVLEVRGLAHRGSGIHDVSFSVRAGEILGIAGLVGSGRTQLAEVLFGLAPADGGEILLKGHAVRIASPADAVQHGIGYVPEDRRQHGVVLEMSIAANASLASLGAVARHGLIDTAAEARSAERHVEQLRIKTPGVATEAGALSGGNQQKVALARWLSIQPAVLILDEPTQGVDVGSKAEIHGLMQTLAERGLAIIMISSELPEVLGMSDRVAVMHAGTIRRILPRADATQDRIMEEAFGAGK